MAGILIIGVYCLFWWLCWMFSGLFGGLNSVTGNARRVLIFLIIGAAPYYIYLYEKHVYENVCDDIKVFFPEKKIDDIKTLIVFSNEWRKVFIKPDGNFSYVISPSENRNWSIDDYIRFRKETLNNNEGNLVSVHDNDDIEIDSSNVLHNDVVMSGRYGYFHAQKEKVLVDGIFVIGMSDYFIYDFQQRKKISNISTASKIRNEKTFIANYMLPFKLESCRYNGSTTELFTKTFNNWNGEL